MLFEPVFHWKKLAEKPGVFQATIRLRQSYVIHARVEEVKGPEGDLTGGKLPCSHCITVEVTRDPQLYGPDLVWTEACTHGLEEAKKRAQLLAWGFKLGLIEAGVRSLER